MKGRIIWVSRDTNHSCFVANKQLFIGQRPPIKDVVHITNTGST
jgi:hypothetical protein